MSTAPDWLREDVVVVPRTRLQRLRRASRGALLVYGAAAVVAVLVVMSVVSFAVKVQARGAARQALEDAAVEALPPGVRVRLQGVYAEGAATGYATGFSPLPPEQLLRGMRPAGSSRWAPVPGTETTSGLRSERAWLSASQRYLLTAQATSCASDRVPAGCPDGGSYLRLQTAPGGPRS